jgi:hypothetical protein
MAGIARRRKIIAVVSGVAVWFALLLLGAGGFQGKMPGLYAVFCIFAGYGGYWIVSRWNQGKPSAPNPS